MATVASVLSESTTMISSAQAIDASASPMSAASLRVMIVTESLGTRAVYLTRFAAGHWALRGKVLRSRGARCFALRSKVLRASLQVLRASLQVLRASRQALRFAARCFAL